MVWKGLGLMGGVARGGFWLKLERMVVGSFGQSKEKICYVDEYGRWYL